MSDRLRRSPVSRLAAALPLAAALGGALACATEIPFLPSTASPAASGAVNADLDDNGNSWVELRLEHLALSGTLTPPRATEGSRDEDSKFSNAPSQRVASPRPGRTE